MRKASLALFVLLPALLAFGRNVTEQDIASALKRALRSRDSLGDTTEVQVSSALETGKDVCIEYRASTASGLTISGLAVYRTEDNLVFLDNSWIWERACLSGKYGQRRNGKDVTHALNASLAAPVAAKPVVVAASAVSPVPANVSVTSPTAAMVAPVAPKVTASAPPEPAPPVAAKPVAAPVIAAVPAKQTTAIATASVPATIGAPAAVAVVAPVPPVAPVTTQATVQSSAPAPVPVAVSAPAAAMPPAVVSAAVAEPVAVRAATPVPPVSAPVRVAPSVAYVATASVPTPQPRMTVAPAEPAMSASASIPLPAASRPVIAPAQDRSAPAEVAIVSHLETAAPPAVVRVSNPAASVETPLHGVTISDDTGALGPPTSSASATAPQESLADAARRVRANR